MAPLKRASGSARNGAKRAARREGSQGGKPGAPQTYNGAVRAHLAELQRGRILSAMFDVAAERGAGSVSVAHVVERSGVSRRTFYEQFADREDCLLAAFEQALSYASACVLPAYRAERSWRERIRAGLIAFLSFLEVEPRLGRMLVVESLAGGPRTLERRGEVVSEVTRAIDEGRGEAKAASPPSLTAEGVVGGVLTILYTRLSSGQAGAQSMVALTNPLMSMIVLPYLGGAAAKRELDRPVASSKPRGTTDVLSLDPFKEAGMRLTYRTVRVLLAIAESPGASNRLIGETAGMTDQGQISKLLSRLQGIGLVSNTGLGPGTGAPNAWALTEKGTRIADGIRAHTPQEGRPS